MTITKIFAKTISNYNNQRSMGVQFRKKRIAPLLVIIETLFNENGRVDIIDVGGTKTYWNIVSEDFLKRNNVYITIVNLSNIHTPTDEGRFKFITADGCDLKIFENNAFHIAHSNSVIEHVGDWSKMVQFAREISRVAPIYFVQIPNFWFPIEPHCFTPFFHWLPIPLRIWLVMHFELGHWGKAQSLDSAVRTVESVRLLNKKMFKEIFKDAQIMAEKLFLLPKSFIALKYKKVS